MPHSLFWVSSGIFVVLNLVENLLHYSLGRHSDTPEHATRTAFVWPTGADWVKIVVIMTVFAVLQGGLTCWIRGC